MMNVMDINGILPNLCIQKNGTFPNAASQKKAKAMPHSVSFCQLKHPRNLNPARPNAPHRPHRAEIQNARRQNCEYPAAGGPNQLADISNEMFVSNKNSPLDGSVILGLTLSPRRIECTHA